MKSAHHKTLKLIFTDPVPLLEWNRVEALLIALGADLIEGRGSRVRFVLNGVIGSFHRPHPAKEAKRYQIQDARQFLSNAGVTHEHNDL